MWNRPHLLDGGSPFLRTPVSWTITPPRGMINNKSAVCLVSVGWGIDTPMRTGRGQGSPAPNIWSSETFNDPPPYWLPPPPESPGHLVLNYFFKQKKSTAAEMYHLNFLLQAWKNIKNVFATPIAPLLIRREKSHYPLITISFHECWYHIFFSRRGAHTPPFYIICCLHFHWGVGWIAWINELVNW